MKMAEEICRRLRFSNDETKQILALVDNHMRFGDVTKMKESTLKRFLRLPEFDEHMELHRLDCLAAMASSTTYEFVRQKRADMPPEKMRPAPLVTGHDLIAAGLRPGPADSERFCRRSRTRNWKARLHSKEEALEFVRREFPL